MGYGDSSTGYAIVGQGFTGTVYFQGTGFAVDQGTGGNVSITTTATGATFSAITEVAGGTEVSATLSTTSSTPGGFYPVTLTDDNGSATLALGLGVDVGPQITTISGNAGVAGSTGASTVTITGANLEGVTPSFSPAAAGCTNPSISAYTDVSNTALSITVNNSAATACTATLVLTSPYPTGGNGVTVASYTVNAVSTTLAITGITPSSLSITGLTAGPPASLTSTSTVTITGAGFLPGAVGTLSNLEAGDIAGSFTYVNSTTLSAQITLSLGVTMTEENITITNPNATSIVGTGILGIGEAASTTPVTVAAPTISCTGANLQAGVQTVFSCTGSSTFPITTSTPFDLTFPGNTTATEGVTGKVLSVTNNVAVINANIPRFASTTTSEILTGGTSTTATVASSVGIPTGTAWIVDGASTEAVDITAVGAGTVTFSAAVANNHASGVTLEWPFTTGVYTVTANNGTNTATSSITVIAPNAPAFNGGATAGSFNPGTYTINANVPGFGFTTGASIVFLGTTGSTGTVTPVNFSNATLSVTVPTTVPEAVTITAAAAAGQDQATLSDTTHVSVGETLTVGPNPTDATKTTQALVVASIAGDLVTFTTNFAQTYVSGDAVAGITEPQPISNLEAVLTNGAGEAIIINPLLGIATVGTATLTTPASHALGDGAGAGGVAFPVVFTLGGGTVTAGTDWTVTSSTAGVSFANGVAASTTTIGADATIATTVAASTTVPVTITNGNLTFTGTFTVDATVPTVTGVTAVGTLGPTNTSEIIGVYGTNFNTADPAANDFCYTTSPQVSCTIYDNGITPPGGSVVTTDTATTLTVVLTTTDTTTANGSNPFPSNGSYGIVVGQNSDGGAGLFSPAVTVAGEPVVTSVSPLTEDAGVEPGTLTVTGTGFIAGTLSCVAQYYAPGDTGVYTALDGCTATYVSATSVTIHDTNTYGAGTVIYEFGDDYTTWSVDTPAVSIINAPIPSFFVFGNDLSINFDVAAGSASAPFKLVGSGFLPGTTLSIPAADGTIAVTTVTPNAIFGTVSIGATVAAGDIIATVTNANGTTGTVDIDVVAAPTIISVNGHLTTPLSVAPVIVGTGSQVVIVGTNLVNGATVALTNTALGSFGTAVVTSSTVPTDPCTTYTGATGNCNTLTVTVSPLSFSGSTPIVTGIVVTNPVGDGSTTVQNDLSINPVPMVTGTYYVPTFTSNAEVTINGTGFETGITASSANPDYTVLAVASTPTTVTLLVTTDSNATSGTSSTITLTNPDGGSGTFPLNGGPNPNTVTPAPKATHVNGVVHTGKTTKVTISGSHFYGQPKITSNAKGTTVHVMGDNGKLLTIKVTTKSTTPRGVHTFIIRFANGEQTNVKYNQVK